LAFIISHEIAHITKGHLTENINYRTSLVHRVISIEDEFEADIEGLKIAVESGYSYKKIINSLKSIASANLI